MANAAPPNWNELARPEARTSLSLEVYGFILWVVSFFLGLGYFIYAFVSHSWWTEFIHTSLGGVFPGATTVGATVDESHLQPKYWVLAIPAWLTTTAIFAFFFYPIYNLSLTYDDDELKTMPDPFARSPDVDQIRRKRAGEKLILSVFDIPQHVIESARASALSKRQSKKIE